MGKMDDSVIRILYNWSTGLRAQIWGLRDGGLHLTSSLLVVCTVNENGKFECRGHKNSHFLHHADP